MSNQPFDKGDRYDSTRESWENIWDGATVELELEAIQYARAQETLNAYLPFLAKDEPLLEAGSGLGAVAITLKEKGYNIIGLDYAVNALQTVQEYEPSLTQVGGDVHALPYGDNSLAAYLSFGVLEHFEHGMTPALEEAYRVLRPGGILVLTIPYPNIVHRFVKWKREQSGETVLNDDDFYESTYTREDMVRIPRDVGFHIRQIHPTSHSYTLWGLGSIFRESGYYRTNWLAENLGALLKRMVPWQFCFETLVIAEK